MIDAEKPIISTIKCKCNEEHTTPLRKIIIEHGAAARAADYIRDLLIAGHIAIIGEVNNPKLSDARHNLRKAGYRVSEILLYDGWDIISEKDQSLEESVRMIIAVGGREVCNLGKLLCKDNVLLVLMPTDLDCDNWVSGRIYNKDQSIKAHKPQVIIFDSDISFSHQCIARGLGLLYLRQISIFDYEYECLINNTKYCSNIIEELKRDIKCFFNNKFDYWSAEDIRRLIVCNADVALKLSYISDEFMDTAESLTTLIDSVGGRNTAPLIAAHSLKSLYSYFLNNIERDILIPPDRTQYFEQLKSYGYDLINCLNNCENDTQTLIEAEFKTNKLREKLIYEINGIGDNTISNLLLSILPDRGYHIKDVIDFEKLMRTIALSSQISERFSLAKYIDKRGLLWHYVK